LRNSVNTIGDFDNPASAHHRDAVGNIIDDREIVRDE